MAVRSLVALAARAALVLGSSAIAVAAFTHAASETKVLPGLGASDPSSLTARIAAERIDNGFTAEMARHGPPAGNDFPRFSSSLIDDAEKTFAVDPLDISAVRTIALGSILQEDPARARRVMRTASQMSKRDAVVNLWLAQDYGQLGDVEAMVESFDHALRTSERVREFAMKPVVEALASPESHAPLGRLLRKNPEWEREFWQEFVQNPVAMTHAAAFFANSQIPIDRLPKRGRKVLYGNLKRTGQFDALLGMAALDPGTDLSNRDLAAGKFVIADGGNPFGWTLYSTGNFTARIQETTGELQIDARSGSFNGVADRVVRGGENLQLAFTMAEPVPENATLRFVVHCLDAANRRELSSLLASPGERSGAITFSGAGCAFTNLTLLVRVDAGRSDSLVRISSITLRPV